MKKLWMVALAALFVTTAVAQQFTPSEGQVLAREAEIDRVVNRMIADLALNDETAMKFAPLYKEYKNRRREVNLKYKMHRAKKPNIKMGEPGTVLTDKQVDENIRTCFAISREILSVREQYYEKFCKIMNPKQIEKMYSLEGRYRAERRKAMLARKKAAVQKAKLRK